LGGVVLTQMVVAALALLAQYDLGRRLAGSLGGVVAGALLALNPEIARWHAFILTDSLYISLVILACWAIHRAAARRGGWYASAFALVVAAALMRPNGWVFFPIAAGYWSFRALSSPGRRWLAGLAILLLCAAAPLTV